MRPGSFQRINSATSARISLPFQRPLFTGNDRPAWQKVAHSWKRISDRNAASNQCPLSRGGELREKEAPINPCPATRAQTVDFATAAAVPTDGLSDFLFRRVDFCICDCPGG